MGYYSRFRPMVELTEEQVQKLSEISYYPDYAIKGDEGIKWYDFEENIKEFSKLYPDQLFCYEITGEESPDIRKAYAQGGKYCNLVPTLTYPYFTEDLLK